MSSENTQPNQAPNWGQIIVGVAIAAVIIYFTEIREKDGAKTSNPAKPVSTTSGKPAKTETPSKKKSEPLSDAELKNPKQALEKLVAGAFPSGDGFEFVKIEPTGPGGDKFFVNISYQSKGATLSEEDSFRTIRIEMAEAYGKILSYPQIPISEVKINAQLKLRDNFGNEAWGDVFRTRIQSEELTKINRSNLKSVSLSAVWDPVFIHPIFFPFKEKVNE